MDRKVYITATVNLILRVDEGTEIEEILSSITAESGTDKADVESFEIVNSEITDSK